MSTVIYPSQIIDTQRNHASVSLALNTARTPNASRDVLVSVVMNMATADGSTTTANALVDNSGGGTFQTIQTLSNDFSVSGLIGVTGHSNLIQTMHFKVPANSQYKITQTGGATITSIYELLD